MSKYRIALMPGDGIGVEVMEAAIAAVIAEGRARTYDMGGTAHPGYGPGSGRKNIRKNRSVALIRVGREENATNHPACSGVRLREKG